MDAGGNLRPVEQRQPVRLGVEVREEEVPVLQSRLDSVVVQGPGPDQRRDTRIGEDALGSARDRRGCGSAAVGGAARPVRRVARALVELAGQQPADRRREGLSRISKVHSSIGYPLPTVPGQTGAMTSTVEEVYERDGIVQVPGLLSRPRSSSSGLPTWIRSPLTTRWRSTTAYRRRPAGALPTVRPPASADRCRGRPAGAGVDAGQPDPRCGHLADRACARCPVDVLLQAAGCSRAGDAPGQHVPAAHPETCLAAWIAVDDVDAENGGLAVVPGSIGSNWSARRRLI